MASLPMFAMHVWSEPSHVVAVACFPECSRALASRCLAGCRSIQTTTATNYYIQLLALAPKARPAGLCFKQATSAAVHPLPAPVPPFLHRGLFGPSWW